MEACKKLILSSNSNNGVKTSLFTFNCNNDVSNANANNGSQLQPVGLTSSYHTCVLYLTSPLGER